MTLTPLRRSLLCSAALIGFASLASCAAAPSYTPFLGAEPGVGEVIAERLPRTLRLYYAALPDVDSSEVTLTGPEGDYTLRGLHTMGRDDLMMEIYQPSLTNGEYTVRWQAVVEGDPQRYEGEYSFEVAIP
jgi:methionine-rich copper-binding protein CopC